MWCFAKSCELIEPDAGRLARPVLWGDLAGRHGSISSLRRCGESHCITLINPIGGKKQLEIYYLAITSSTRIIWAGNTPRRFKIHIGSVQDRYSQFRLARSNEVSSIVLMDSLAAFVSLKGCRLAGWASKSVTRAWAKLCHKIGLLAVGDGTGIPTRNKPAGHFNIKWTGTLWFSIPIQETSHLFACAYKVAQGWNSLKVGTPENGQYCPLGAIITWLLNSARSVPPFFFYRAGEALHLCFFFIIYKKKKTKKKGGSEEKVLLFRNFAQAERNQARGGDSPSRCLSQLRRQKEYLFFFRYICKSRKKSDECKPGRGQDNWVSECRTNDPDIWFKPTFSRVGSRAPQKASWIQYCYQRRISHSATNTGWGYTRERRKYSTSRKDQTSKKWTADWKAIESKVYEDQIKLVKLAQTNGGTNWPDVLKRQRTLALNLKFRMLAVQKAVTNSYTSLGKSPGIDGDSLSSDQGKWEMVENLKSYILKAEAYQAQPVKRVYIPKSAVECLSGFRDTMPQRAYQRLRAYAPLGKWDLPLVIPTITDRCLQGLVKLVLEPLVEMNSDKHSYGFRKYRSAKMGVGGWASLSNKLESFPEHSDKFVLDAVIKGFFDKISHEWLVNHVPLERTLILILRGWLKAGSIYIDQEGEYGVSGTPLQKLGGILSPTLCNFTLNGLELTIEQAVQREYKLRRLGSRGWISIGKLTRGVASLEEKSKYEYLRSQLGTIRYGDEFVVLARSRRIIEETIRPHVERFLSERGLTLSGDQTKVLSVINSEPIDFLGYSFARVRLSEGLQRCSFARPSPPTAEQSWVFDSYGVKKVCEHHRYAVKHDQHSSSGERDRFAFPPLLSERRKNKKQKIWLAKRPPIKRGSSFASKKKIIFFRSEVEFLEDKVFPPLATKKSRFAINREDQEWACYPQKKKYQAIMGKLKAILAKSTNLTAYTLISKLNPIIRGWAQYFNLSKSYYVRNRMNGELFRLTFAWARRKHPRWGKTNIAKRYFIKNRKLTVSTLGDMDYTTGNDKKWVFTGYTQSESIYSESKGGKIIELLNPTKVVSTVTASRYRIPERLELVHAYHDKYEELIDFNYGMSKQAMKDNTSFKAKLLINQKGRCGICGTSLLDDHGEFNYDGSNHIHQIQPRSNKGGKNQIKKVMLVHSQHAPQGV